MASYISSPFSHPFLQERAIGSLGKVERGQVVVTSHYADSRKDWPIDHRPYLPRKWVEEQNECRGEEVYVFKSKLVLGLELIDDVLERGIRTNAGYSIPDSWYRMLVSSI